MKSLLLRWTLHCSALEFDDHADFLRKNGGVYFWIYTNQAGSRVAYVGEARQYHVRLYQHLSCMISGLYNTYRVPEHVDYVSFLGDVLSHSTDISSKAARIEALLRHRDRMYIPVAPHDAEFLFTRAFTDPDAIAMHMEYLKHLTFAFAPLTTERDRLDAEGALLCGLRRIYCRQLGIPEGDDSSFRLLGGNSNDTPLGRITQYPSCDLQISYEFAPDVVLPREINSVIGYEAGAPRIQ